MRPGGDAEDVQIGSYAVITERVAAGDGVPPAVRNLSLHVPRGSIYGLAGPKRAGKTTALRALATLQPLIWGRAEVDGLDITHSVRAVRARVGYLPDSSGMYDHLSVWEYMTFYSGINGLPRGRRKRVIDELLELVDLHGERNTPVRDLSRSMRQQLRLARCLVHDPSVLLLDEPTDGLDPGARLDLRDILQELARLGKTVVLCSNLLSELEEVCTHIGIMQRGELRIEGLVSDVMEAVLPHPQLRIALGGPRDTDIGRRVLGEHPACSDITVDGLLLLTTYTGGGAGLQAILTDLIAAGSGVREFSLHRPQLEDVYLRVLDVEASA